MNRTFPPLIEAEFQRYRILGERAMPGVNLSAPGKPEHERFEVSGFRT